jgi:hypothetical protein
LPLPLFERICGKTVVAFREDRTLGIRKNPDFRGRNPTAHTLACLRQRLPRYRDRRKARYRLGRAHPWPDGIRTRWTTDRSFMESSHLLQSQSTSRAWSHSSPQLPSTAASLTSLRHGPVATREALSQRGQAFLDALEHAQG